MVSECVRLLRGNQADHLWLAAALWPQMPHSARDKKTPATNITVRDLQLCSFVVSPTEETDPETKVALGGNWTPEQDQEMSNKILRFKEQVTSQSTFYLTDEIISAHMHNYDNWDLVFFLLKQLLGTFRGNQHHQFWNSKVVKILFAFTIMTCFCVTPK